MNTYISAIDYYLPKQVVKTRDMMAETKPERLGFSETLIEDLVGIIEVRHADKDEKPSKLATIASEKALAKFEGNVDEIEMIIFCGMERDYIEPSTAHIIQANLGLKNAVCFDVSNACLGFMTGIQIATAAITSKVAKNVLLCTGERPSDITKNAMSQLINSSEKEHFFGKLGILTVGDAGAAAIISPTDEPRGIISMNSSSDGKLAKLCHYRYVNGLPEGEMLMKEISNAILDAHEALLPITLKNIWLDISDINCLITHQVGKRPWERYPKMMGVSQDNMTKTFDTLGNITSATFGVNYAKALESGRILPGDTIMAAMAGSGLSVCQATLVA